MLAAQSTLEERPVQTVTLKRPATVFFWLIVSIPLAGLLLAFPIVPFALVYG